MDQGIVRLPIVSYRHGASHSEQKQSSLSNLGINNSCRLNIIFSFVPIVNMLRMRRPHSSFGPCWIFAQLAIGIIVRFTSFWFYMTVL